MDIEDRLVKEAHILLHPTRYRIAKLLAEKPRHISELIEALGEDGRLVSYHLLTLEEHGFVSSKFDFPQEALAKSKEAMSGVRIMVSVPTFDEPNSYLVISW